MHSKHFHPHDPTPAPFGRRRTPQCQRNAEYYRGLVQQCGALLGPEAYTADDGGGHEDVLCAKVPEVLEARLNSHNEPPSPRLYAWQPRGHDGRHSFFVLSTSEEEAQKQVDDSIKAQLRDGHLADYYVQGWGTDYYELTVLGMNEVIDHPND